MNLSLLRKTIVFLFAFTSSVNAQFLIQSLNSPHTIDFTGFAGAGFSSTPTAIQLDSDTWSIYGWSDGNLYFGGTKTAGDFARGTSQTLTTGGVYGWNINGSNVLGALPTATEFNPGYFLLKIQNTTGNVIKDLRLKYDIVVNNSSDRSSTFNLSYSFDTLTYTMVPAANFTTPLTADATWASFPIDVTLNDINLANQAFFYLRWTNTEVPGGTGARDRVGLDNISITGITPVIVADFTATDACYLTSTNFTNSSSTINGTITSYKWFIENDILTVENPTHTFSAAGNYNVKLVVTNSNNDKDSITKTIVVNPLPSTSLSLSPLSGCAPLPVNFQNTTTISTGSVSNIIWRFGDGGTSTSNMGIKTYTQPGEYTLMLATYSDKGCKDSTFRSIEAFPEPVVTFTISDTSSCAPLCFNYDNATSISSGFIADFEWMFSDGTTSTDGSGSKCFASGNYSVVLRAVSDKGCTASKARSLYSNPYPLAKFSVIDSVGCAPFCVYYSSTSTLSLGTIESTEWLFGSSMTSGDATGTQCFTPGVYSIRLIATSNKGCADTITKFSFIESNTPPVADFTIQPSGLTVTVTGNPTGGTQPYSVEYSYDGGLTFSSSTNHTYTQNGTYSICAAVDDAKGCADTICKSVTLVSTGIESASTSKLTIYPNPSANGLFTINSTEADVTEIMIYDLLGKVVYKDADPESKSGKVGVDLSVQPAGSYFMKIQSGDEVIIKRVSINK